MFTGQRTLCLQKTGKVCLEVKDYGIETKTGAVLTVHTEAHSLHSSTNDGNNYRN